MKIIIEKKRVPRKKGQPAKSKKHSDLYTDEDPKGTIHGLGFKDVAKARASVAKIRKSSRSHAHKTQAAIAMEQRAKAAGKTSEAAVFRKFIEQQKEKTKTKKETVKEQRMSLAPGTPPDPRDEPYFKEYEKLGDRIGSAETNPGSGKSYSGGFDFDSAETGAGRSYYDFDSLETNPGFDSAKTGAGRGGLPTVGNMIKDAKRRADIRPVLALDPKEAAKDMAKTAKVPRSAFKGFVAVDVALYAKEVYDIVNNKKMSLRQQEDALWGLAEDAAKEAALATGAAALGPLGLAAYGTYVVARALSQLPGRSFEKKDASGRTIDLHGGERETYPMRSFRTFQESLTLEDIILEELDNVLSEKCWPGYEKKGMKTMFGKRYPNCVKKTKKKGKKRRKKRKNEEIEEGKQCALNEEGKECPVHGKKACPVEEYDISELQQMDEKGLRDWFGKSSGKTKSGRRVKGWVQVGGKYDGAPCAKQPGQKTKPKCVSSGKRRSMSKKERESAARRKRKKDSNPNRRGKPINVSTDPKRKRKRKTKKKVKETKANWYEPHL